MPGATLKKLYLNMRSSVSYFKFLITVTVFVYACDVVNVEEIHPLLPVHERDKKPDTPVELGTLRGYFGDYYLTFAQHIEKVQPVDSFSNCYFYGSCNGYPINQINLIRCNSDLILAIYLNGYPLDSLPLSLPINQEYGKYSSIELYSFGNWNWGDPGYYSLSDFYGNSVLVTDVTDDIVTGTFKGTLRSSAGGMTPVTDGEFKLKIFRKDMTCKPSDGN